MTKRRTQGKHDEEVQQRIETHEKKHNVNEKHEKWNVGDVDIDIFGCYYQ
jgi:hypothetical protein